MQQRSYKVTAMIAFALILFAELTPLVFGGSEFPFCSTTLYDENNEVDVESMLFHCSKTIRGSMFPPSYFQKRSDSNEYKPTLVNVSLAFNTIVNIDDVHASVTLDFWFRQFWYDPRWKLPDEVWQSINPAGYVEGLELMPYIRSQNPLNFWLPDTYILEAVSSDIQAEMVHLFQDGSVWWSRHFVLVVKQGQFNLKQYPLDVQRFTLTLQSWAYATQYVVLFPFREKGPGLIRFNQDPTLKIDYIKEDPLWKYREAFTTVEEQRLGSFFDPNRNYSTISIILEFERESYGILFRLALPILMFLFLVGFAFWSDISHRVEVTITMLLAVSAFYLIIGQVIPFVGYFSLLDKFITTAFCILSMTAGVHYMTSNLDTEKYKYPFNAFLRDVIVFLCRAFWVPFIFTAGTIFFKHVYLSNKFVIIGVGFLLILTSINTLLHYQEIDIVFRKSLCQLRVKHYYKEKNKPYLSECRDENMLEGENIVTLDLTTFEVLLYSYTYYFHVECACEKKIHREHLKYTERQAEAAKDIAANAAPSPKELATVKPKAPPAITAKAKTWDKVTSFKNVDIEEGKDSDSEGEEDNRVHSIYDNGSASMDSVVTKKQVVLKSVSNSSNSNGRIVPEPPGLLVDASNASLFGNENDEESNNRNNNNTNNNNGFLPANTAIPNKLGSSSRENIHFRKQMKILPDGTRIINEEEFFAVPNDDDDDDKQSFKARMRKKSSFGRFFFNSRDRRSALSWFFHTSHMKKTQLSKDHTFFCQHLNIAMDVIDQMIADHKKENHRDSVAASRNCDFTALSSSSYVYHGSCENKFCYRCTTKEGQSYLSNVCSLPFFRFRGKQNSNKK
jgi:hypothetical protein